MRANTSPSRAAAMSLAIAAALLWAQPAQAIDTNWVGPNNSKGFALFGDTPVSASLTLKATSGTPASGAHINFQTTSDYWDAFGEGFVLHGTTPLLLSATGQQNISKTGGTLGIGTLDANVLNLVTNGTPGITIGATQTVQLPSLAGAGSQCVQADNTGTLSGTGTACGAGGAGGGGGGITQIIGDVTAGPGSGSQAATIAANAVTVLKFQQLPGLSLLAVPGGSTANTSALTATANNQVAQMLGGTLQFHALDFSQLTGTPPAITSLTGPITGAGPGATATTITANAVTLANLQQLTGLSLLGVAGGSTANMAAVTATANNQVAQELAGVLQFHTLDFSQLTGTPPAMTSVTGDVVGTGPGATATTIQPNVVSFAKTQQIPAFSVVANPTSSMANETTVACSADGQFVGRAAGALTCTSTIAATSAPLAAGAIGFGSAGGLLTGDAANAHWDGTNFRFGLGVATPLYQAHFRSQSTDADFANRGLTETVYNGSGTGSPLHRLQTYAGSAGAPAIVLNTSYLGTFTYEAFDGSGLLDVVQVGTHATNGATMAAGSLPSTYYVAMDPRGLSNPFTAGNPLPLQIQVTPTSPRGFTSAVAIGAQPGTNLGSGTILSLIGSGVSGSGSNARVSLSNPTAGADQDASYGLSNTATGATLTLKSATTTALEGVNALILSSGSNGGSVWLEASGKPTFEAVTNFLIGDASVGAVRVHANLIGGTSTGGTQASLELLNNVANTDATKAAFLTAVGNSNSVVGNSYLALGNPQGRVGFYVGQTSVFAGTPLTPTFYFDYAASGIGSTVQGSGAALARSATDGFFYVATMAGSPTGTPTAQGSASPITVDTTNHALDFNVGGTWYSLTPSTAATIAESQVAGLTADLAGKQATGNYLVGLGSAVTATGPGTPTATVHLDAGATVAGLLPLGNEGAPTGTGFAAVSSGAWSGAARAVNLATGDVTGLLPVADLSVGTTGQIVAMSGGVPAWVTPAAGTVYTGLAPIIVNAGTGVISCPTCDTATLAPIATSGSASDLSTGTVPAARLGSFANGSVLFWNSGLAQNNANFFWDNTNVRLGIGMSSPSYSLDILNTTNGVAGFRVSNQSTGTSAQVQNQLANNAGELAYFGIAGTNFTGFAPLNGGSAFFGSDATQVSIFTQTANPIVFYTNATPVGQWTIGGAFQVSDLGAGGIVNAAATTGQLGIASSGNIAAALGFPTTNLVLVSSSTSSAPFGDSNFTFNPSTHTLTSAVATVLGGSLTLSTASAILKTNGGGVVGPASAGSDYSAGTASIASGPLCNTTGTGALSACTSGALATAIGFPTTDLILFSASTSAAPSGDATFSFNPSTKTESVQNVTISSDLVVGTNFRLSLAPAGAATFDGSGNLGSVPQPAVADYDWSVSFVNSATGLVSNSGAFLIPSGDYGATIETADSLVPGGTNAGNALAGVYATTRMPFLQDVTQAFRGGVFSCSLWYGQQAGIGSSTVEYDLAYSTNPSTGSSTSHLLSSIVTTNVGSVLQNLGTNTFSTSVPAGSYLYVAIYRTDANNAMAVLNINARCKAELYK